MGACDRLLLDQCTVGLGEGRVEELNVDEVHLVHRQSDYSDGIVSLVRVCRDKWSGIPDVTSCVALTFGKVPTQLVGDTIIERSWGEKRHHDVGVSDKTCSKGTKWLRVSCRRTLATSLDVKCKN